MVAGPLAKPASMASRSAEIVLAKTPCVTDNRPAAETDADFQASRDMAAVESSALWDLLAADSMAHLDPLAAESSACLDPLETDPATLRLTSVADFSMRSVLTGTHFASRFPWRTRSKAPHHAHCTAPYPLQASS